MMLGLDNNKSGGLWLLEQEARALLTRLARVKPFALQETMAAAAAISAPAQSAIERHLLAGRARLRQQVLEYLKWLKRGSGQAATPAAAQRRFTLLRMRFNATLAQLDIFAASMTQRSESCWRLVKGRCRASRRLSPLTGRESFGAPRWKKLCR